VLHCKGPLTRQLQLAGRLTIHPTLHPLGRSSATKALSRVGSALQGLRQQQVLGQAPPHAAAGVAVMKVMVMVMVCWVALQPRSSVWAAGSVSLVVLISRHLGGPCMQVHLRALLGVVWVVVVVVVVTRQAAADSHRMLGLMVLVLLVLTLMLMQQVLCHLGLRLATLLALL